VQAFRPCEEINVQRRNRGTRRNRYFKVLPCSASSGSTSDFFSRLFGPPWRLQKISDCETSDLKLQACDFRLTREDREKWVYATIEMGARGFCAAPDGAGGACCSAPDG